MRVISGSLKGHTLFAPKGRRLRPTSDQVKETLFNMIGSCVVQATFLDVFAGTGGIGIEALSREAKWGVFIEKRDRLLFLYDLSASRDSLLPSRKSSLSPLNKLI